MKRWTHKIWWHWSSWQLHSRLASATVSRQCRMQGPTLASTSAAATGRRRIDWPPVHVIMRPSNWSCYHETLWLVTMSCHALRPQDQDLESVRLGPGLLGRRVSGGDTIWQGRVEITLVMSEDWPLIDSVKTGLWLVLNLSLTSHWSSKWRLSYDWILTSFSLSFSVNFVTQETEWGSDLQQ